MPVALCDKAVHEHLHPLQDVAAMHIVPGSRYNG